MYALLVVIHIFISLTLVITILMQSSKGGGLAGAFGGAGTSAVFGGRGAASFLQKLTTSLVVAFMFIAILIGFTTKPGSQNASLIQEAAEKQAAGQGAALPVPASFPALNQENPGN